MGLSLKGYADHRKKHGLRGQTHVAVLQAIQAGRLTEPAAIKRGSRWEIDPILADAQWAGNTELKNIENHVADQKLDEIRKGQTDAAQEGSLAGIPQIVVSKAVRAAYDAKLAELEYKKQIGERVPVAEVRREAFSLARRVREALLNIPDRVAAELAAEMDAAAVHMRLTAELRQALTEIADG